MKVPRKSLAAPVVYRLADIKAARQAAAAKQLEEKLRKQWEANDRRYQQALYGRAGVQQTFYTYRIPDKFPLHLADLVPDAIYLAPFLITATQSEKPRAVLGRDISERWASLPLVTATPVLCKLHRRSMDEALKRNRYYRVVLPSGRYLLLQKLPPRYARYTLTEINQLLRWDDV